MLLMSFPTQLLTLDHFFQLFHRGCVFGVRENCRILSSNHKKYILFWEGEKNEWQ